MYCSSIWFDSTVTSMRKLKIACNNGLRRILKLPKYNSASEMFVNLNIPSFDELLRKYVYSFRSRIQDSGNSLVNGIVKSSVPLFSCCCCLPQSVHLFSPGFLGLKSLTP